MSELECLETRISQIVKLYLDSKVESEETKTILNSSKLPDQCINGRILPEIALLNTEIEKADEYLGKKYDKQIKQSFNSAIEISKPSNLLEIFDEAMISHITNNQAMLEKKIIKIKTKK
ncbi:MAG: hypothetical protein MHPSP_003202, partial [Paramarteilia canceri]